MEIWKDIQGYEGYYQVSNLGRIKNVKNGKNKVRKISYDKLGYPYINLSKNGIRKTKKVYRIVAETFIPNPENKKTVNHKDGDPSNSKIDNLEWATHQENINHAWETGLSDYGYGIILEDKKTKEIKIFRSMNKASLFIGKSQNYISERVRMNKFENKDYKWSFKTTQKMFDFIESNKKHTISKDEISVIKEQIEFYEIAIRNKKKEISKMFEKKRELQDKINWYDEINQKEGQND